MATQPAADELASHALELYERRCSIDGWDLDEWADPDGELVPCFRSSPRPSSPPS